MKSSVNNLATVETAIGRLNQSLAAAGETADGEQASIADRLSTIETSLAQLQANFAGISLQSASEERDALFRAEDGHLKADEYAAAGKLHPAW